MKGNRTLNCKGGEKKYRKNNRQKRKTERNGNK
jgi:hypothetical protein